MINYDVIRMAWSDKTSFDEIKKTDFSEKGIIKLMGKNLKKKVLFY